MWLIAVVLLAPAPFVRDKRSLDGAWVLTWNDQASDVVLKRGRWAYTRGSMTSWAGTYTWDPTTEILAVKERSITGGTYEWSVRLALYPNGALRGMTPGGILVVLERKR